MPGKRTDVFEEWIRFVVPATLEDAASLAELCREAGISRECGYKWLKRYREGGAEGLRDVSQAPRRRPWAMDEAVTQVGGGAAAGAAWLGRAEVSDEADGAASGDSLAGGVGPGGVAAPEGSGGGAAAARGAAAAVAPNDEWAIGFKRWFRQMGSDAIRRR